jgi:hypothetical protein
LTSLVGGCEGFCPDLTGSMEPQQVYAQRIRDGKGGMVAIEGAQLGGAFSGDRCTEFTSELAKRYDMALSASSGDYGSHMEYVKDVADHGGELVFVGYSAGCDEVRRLAQECEEKLPNKKIGLVFLDPTFVGGLFSEDGNKIPKNVEYVISARAEDGFWGGGKDITQDYFTNPETDLIAQTFPAIIDGDVNDHLEVPSREDIRNFVKENLDAKLR